MDKRAQERRHASGGLRRRSTLPSSPVLRPPYVPSGYLSYGNRSPRLWRSPFEAARHITFARTMLREALGIVERRFERAFSRSLHACLFASERDATAMLHRNVPDTMLMAPYCDDAISLVVLHSGALHAANADAARMRRHLVHELVHLMNAEVTGSRWALGDRHAHMRIPSWLDEGLAEVISLQSAGRDERISRAHRSEGFTRDWTFRDLSVVLDDLSSPLRPMAFEVCTAVVDKLLERRKPAEVLADAERVRLFESLRISGGG